MVNIEIPAPVIVPRIDWITTNEETWVVEVEAGDVVVLTVNVPRQWTGAGCDWASHSEEAEKAALTEFGNRLRKLIGD